MATDKTITLTLEHATLLKSAASLAHAYLGRQHPEAGTPALVEAIDAIRDEIAAVVEGRRTCYPHHTWIDPTAKPDQPCVCGRMLWPSSGRAVDVREA